MSKKTILTWLIVLAAIAAVLGYSVWHVAHEGAKAYSRNFTSISIRDKNGTCVVLNKTVPRMFARPGDTVTWLIAGRCAGHRVGIKNFRLIDPATEDPTTKDKDEPTQVEATSGEVIQLTLRNDATVGAYAYDIEIEPRPTGSLPSGNPPPALPDDAGPVLMVCHDWPCK